MPQANSTNRTILAKRTMPQNPQDSCIADDSLDLFVPCNLADARDEMNLADQPLGVLDEETAKTQKTRVLAIGTYGTLKIEAGSSGLLTVEDEEVLLGLMALTQLRTGFSDRTLEFTRGELLEILQRPNKGQSYNKIKTSIYRLMGVLLDYQNSWWDKRSGRRTNALFHILESAHIFGQDDQENMSQVKCKIRWNEVFFASCQSGYLCKLDLLTQFKLRSPVAKTLRRFLNKKFFNQEELVFDLAKLAKIIGLSEKYTDAGKIKEKLRVGLEELKNIDFLKSYSYSNPSRGIWRIHFQRGSAWRATDTQPGNADLLWPTSSKSNEPNQQVIETTATVLPPAPSPLPKLTKPKSFQESPKKTPKSKTIPKRGPRRTFKPATKFSGQPAEPVRATIAPSPQPLSAVTNELILRGVSESEASRLAAERDEAYLTQKIDEFDYRMGIGQAPNNPGAFLATSIRNNYAAPAGYVPRAEREQKAQEQAQRQAAEQAEAARACEAKAQETQLGCLIRAVGSDELVKLGEEDLNNHPEKWLGIDPKGPLARGMKVGAGKEVIREELREKGAKTTAKRLGVEKTLKAQGCVEWGGKQCQVAGCQRRKGLTLEEVAELNKPREN